MVPDAARGRGGIRGVLSVACALAVLAAVRAPAAALPTRPLSGAAIRRITAHPQGMYLDIERRTFEYFWQTTDPQTGLAPDRWPTSAPSSIAATGFALTAEVIGAARGYVSRRAAAERVRTTLAFLLSLPQGPQRTGEAGYHGFFYHFLNLHTGLRAPRSELSTIDTALLMAGVLTAEGYFDKPTPLERQVRTLARQLYLRVDWRWAEPGGDPRVSVAWFPTTGFAHLRWAGYNEASLLYILGMGSPTHPLRAGAWRAWTSTYGSDWRHLDGQTMLAFGPQFGHQYTAVWIDLRGIADKFMRAHGETYFGNARRATLAQRQYAIRDPLGWDGYGPDIWGLTTCDGPGDVQAPFRHSLRRFYSYVARGIAPPYVDDGTLAPTAVVGSLPFDPRIVTLATTALLRKYGTLIYTHYGFLDAFNPSFTDAALARHGHVAPGLGWVDGNYLGIDQGPILAMIANERGGLIWRILRHNPYIRRGLRRAGFQGGWLHSPAGRSSRAR